MDIFKQEMTKHVCIGGLHCPCCNDFHGKSKNILNRMARRALKRELHKEYNEYKEAA